MSTSHHLDRPGVEACSLPRLAGEEHGLPAGQPLRPAVRQLALRLVEGRQRLGLAAGRRDPHQAREPEGAKTIGAVGPPGGAAAAVERRRA